MVGVNFKKGHMQLKCNFNSALHCTVPLQSMKLHDTGNTVEVWSSPKTVS